MAIRVSSATVNDWALAIIVIIVIVVLFGADIGLLSLIALIAFEAARSSDRECGCSSAAPCSTHKHSGETFDNGPPLAPTTPAPYPGAIDAVSVPLEASVEAIDGDEGMARQGSQRNIHERVVAGTMRRRRDLEPHLVDELNRVEDLPWWGRHEY